MNYTDERLSIDPAAHRVHLDGREIPLTRKETDLLAALAANEGETVSRRILLREIWGYPEYVQTRTLDVHIRRLRKKLGEAGGDYIETVFNSGYRFRKPRPDSHFSPVFPFAA